MRIHPVADLFPTMSADEFTSLKADVAAHGLREPIWTHEGAVIDGRHRLRACQELGIEPRFQEWDGQGSLVAFVLSLNLHRRHLTAGQRAALGAEVQPLLAEEAKERQKAAGGDKKSAKAKEAKGSVVANVPQPISEPAPKAREQAAKLTCSGARSVQDAKKVKAADPALFEKVKAGEVTLPQASRVVRRAEKLAELEERAAATASPSGPSWEVRCGDCLAGQGQRGDATENRP